MARALLIGLLLAGPQDRPPSFGRADRLVAALYHAGPETLHPAELAEMGKVGIDMAVLVAGPEGDLSPAGRAVEDLRRGGSECPLLAPLLDLGAAAEPDLSAAAGRAPILAQVRRFARQVPPRARAGLDGRPILWLAPAPPGTRCDRPSFEALSQECSRELGGAAPFWAADLSWGPLPADFRYAHAPGPAVPRGVDAATVSPGRERDGGKVYERSWYVALRQEARWILVDSWNGEGTEVRETKAHGRKYAEATRLHIRTFRLGERTFLPKGKLTGAPKVLYTAVFTPHEQGLRPVANDDGLHEFVQLRGLAALTSKENRLGSRRHLYFDVDDSFCFFEKRSFRVHVEFMDAGEGAFVLEYDSGDGRLSPAERVARRAGEARFTGTNEWRTEVFDLPDALFANGQKGGADFRLAVDRRGISVRSVAVAPR
jgi:hypothetical protein